MACNLCGGRQTEEIQVQRGFRILCEGREIPFDIRTVLCPACGLVFTDPAPDATLLARFYAAQERDAFVDGSGATRIPAAESRRDQARWLESHLGALSGRSVLEVGCYEGYLLALLQERGARCVGIEPCVEASRLARRRWGVEVRSACFEEADFGEQRFDLVVLSHVLEHLRDPRSTLRRCRALLAPGGSLFVEVPNVLRPRVESAVNFFTFDHLFNFCPETLSELARSCGFAATALDDDFPFPAFRYLGRATDAADPSVRPRPDVAAACRTAASEYVARRIRFLERLRSRIDCEIEGWLADARRVAIYGAGYHTECLLDATDLQRANLVALVDGNPAKQGGTIFGLPVVAPEELPDWKPDVVVISSYDFQDEMVERLERLGLPELEVLTFYDRIHAFSRGGREIPVADPLAP